jgi:hypothetical protein
MKAIEEFAKWVLEEATPRDLDAIEADLHVASHVLKYGEMSPQEESAWLTLVGMSTSFAVAEAAEAKVTP